MDFNSIINQTKFAIDVAKYIMDSQDILDKSEQKLKLAELIESLAAIKIETSEIKSSMYLKDEKILELEKKLNFNQSLIYERPYYWSYEATNKDGPFCQKCYDLDRKAIRLEKWNTETYSCLVCKSEFMTDKQRELEAKDALESIKRFKSHNKN